MGIIDILLGRKRIDGSRSYQAVPNEGSDTASEDRVRLLPDNNRRQSLYGAILNGGRKSTDHKRSKTSDSLEAKLGRRSIMVEKQVFVDSALKNALQAGPETDIVFALNPNYKQNIVHVQTFEGPTTFITHCDEVAQVQPADADAHFHPSLHAIATKAGKRHLAAADVAANGDRTSLESTPRQHLIDAATQFRNDGHLPCVQCIIKLRVLTNGPTDEPTKSPASKFVMRAIDIGSGLVVNIELGLRGGNQGEPCAEPGCRRCCCHCWLFTDPNTGLEVAVAACVRDIDRLELAGEEDIFGQGEADTTANSHN